MSSSFGTAALLAPAVINPPESGEGFCNYFIVPYLLTHVIQDGSYQYAYLLWAIAGGTLIFWSLVSHYNYLGGSPISASFRKWSIRRIVIGGGVKTDAAGKSVRKSAWSSPTIAQSMVIFGFFLLTTLVSLVGNDFILYAPCLFVGTCVDTKSLNTGKLDFIIPTEPKIEIPLSITTEPVQNSTIIRRHQSKTRFNLHKRAEPNVVPIDPASDLPVGLIQVKAGFWTTGDRVGLIAYAILPLCISFALKQWPFNILATPFLVNYHFDKTALLHQWAGRIVWFLSTIHTILWGVRLSIDKDPFGRPVGWGIWCFSKFNYGVAAYVLLTMLFMGSLSSLRHNYFEVFFVAHMILALLFLVACILHHPQTGGWVVAAITLWGSERLFRLIYTVYINGIIGMRRLGAVRSRDTGYYRSGIQEVSEWSEKEKSMMSRPGDEVETLEYGQNKRNTRRRSYYSHGFGAPAKSSAPHTKYSTYRKKEIKPQRSWRNFWKAVPAVAAPPEYSSPPPSPLTPLPPAGYAFAQMLPGKTIRLTIHVPRPVRWLPGQHLIVTIPSVRAFQGHAYTITSVDPRLPGILPPGGGSTLRSDGSECVLIIRAQKGFSKDLWDKVVSMRQKQDESHASIGDPSAGVNLRAFVSRPMGSSGRASWGSYSSIIIVAGGTGCTFGISVLEYACRRIARREAMQKVGLDDDDENGDFLATRVRFVWVIREYAHLSWLAPTLRRCLEMVGPSQLQLDLFVTRDKDNKPTGEKQQELARKKAASLAKLETGAHHRVPYPDAPRDEDDSDEDTDNDSDDGETPEYRQVNGDHEMMVDLVHFGWEDNETTPGDAKLSQKIRTEGKMRRRSSRSSGALNGELEDEATALPESSGAAENSAPVSLSDFNVNIFNSAPAPPVTTRTSPTKPRPAKIHFAASSDKSEQSSPYSGQFSPYPILDYYSAPEVIEDHRSSTQTLVANAPLPSAFAIKMRDEAEEKVYLDVTDEDEEDLNLISELAKAGHPNLEKIFDQELARSEGKTIVGCCGPTAMNTLVRHLVSDRIDLGKILEGDPRGQLSLVCEDFGE